MSNVGNLIKEKRELSRLSLKKLGLLCGVSDTEIMKIENGSRKNPNWATLCEIACALGFHPFELLLEAGYISKQDIHPNLAIRRLDELSEEDIQIVQLFIDFLISNKSLTKSLKEEYINEI